MLPIIPNTGDCVPSKIGLIILKEAFDVAERTFVMAKPDGVGRRLVGELIQRFEAKGLKLVALKLQIMSADLAKTHYEEHADKPFFGELVDFITSGPTVQMVWEGNGAVDTVRKMNGATNCLNADVGTIRGDLGLSMQNNIVHASDSVDTAKREIALYFNENEIWDYTMPDEHWLV
jgi:nucleoside-diphosphate kinase